MQVGGAKVSVRSRQLEGIHLQLITQKKPKKTKMADTELAQVYKKNKTKTRVTDVTTST